MYRRDTEEAIPLHPGYTSWPCLTYSPLEAGEKNGLQNCPERGGTGWKAIRRTAQHPNRRAQAQLGLVMVNIICYQAG